MKQSSEIAHRVIDNKSKDILDQIGVYQTRMSLNPFFPNRVVLAMSKGAAERSHKASGSGGPFCEQPRRVVQIARNNSSEFSDDERRKKFVAPKNVVDRADGISNDKRLASQEKATLGGTGEQANRKAILDMVDGFGFAAPKSVSIAYQISKEWTPARIDRLLRPARLLAPPRPSPPAAGTSTGIFLPQQSEMLLWNFEGFNFRSQDGVVRTQDTTRETSNTHLRICG